MDILFAVGTTLLLYLFLRLDAVRQATTVALYAFVLCLGIDEVVESWAAIVCLLVFAGGMLAAIAFIINSGTYSAENDRYTKVVNADVDYLSDFASLFGVSAALFGYASRSHIMLIQAAEQTSNELMFPMLTCALLLALYAGSMLSKLTKY